jgi:branched-chain amino acid transport system permease protein
MHSTLKYSAGLLALIIAPAVIYPGLLMKFLCFALFACAYNILAGYTRLMSFGHAAMFGGAAYLSGYCVMRYGVGLEMVLLIGLLSGALIGLVMGALAIRRDGVYFTMVTLALAQLMYFVWLQAPFTGGEDGLQGIPRPKLGGVIPISTTLEMYYLVLALFALSFVAINRLINSPFANVLKAIKDNEPRAISLGYEVNRYKLLAFVLSSAFSGLAGAMKSTLVLGLATLPDMHWTMSGVVVLMCLVGGIGTALGPVVGAAVIVLLENRLGDMGAAIAAWTGIDQLKVLAESTGTAMGIIFMIMVLMFRRGIVGELAVRLNVRRSMAPEAKPVAPVAGEAR